MQKTFLAAAVAALLGLGGAASASDLYTGGSMKDAPVPLYVPIWPGLYAGVNGGGGWGGTGNLTSSCTPVIYGIQVSETITETCKERDDPKLKSSGGFFGGQIGYNWQSDRIVYGLEGDFQGSWIRGSASTSLPDDDGPIVTNAKSSLDWFGTIRGRLGYAILDNTLLYGTGGFAFGGVKDKLTVSEAAPEGVLASTRNDKTETGYAVGGGLEYAFNSHWSANIEYQYINLGSTTLAISTSEGGDLIKAGIKVDHAYDTVRAGLNYHIGETYQPLK